MFLAERIDACSDLPCQSGGQTGRPFMWWGQRSGRRKAFHHYSNTNLVRNLELSEASLREGNKRKKRGKEPSLDLLVSLHQSLEYQRVYSPLFGDLKAVF